MASNRYWRERVLADEARAQAIAGNASREMARMYRQQYLRVMKEIRALRDQIDYGKELTRTQLWNYARWRKVEEALRDFVQESTLFDVEQIESALNEEFLAVIGAEVEGYGGALGREGIMQLTQIERNRILSGTWSGEHFSARVWRSTSAIADKMRTEITNMLVDGKSTQDIRRAVMRQFGATYANADRLVRTEMSYSFNQLELSNCRASGRQYVQIVTAEDASMCDRCAELTDKVFPIDSAPFLPVHPRCRCCYAPWVEPLDDEEETDEDAE